MALVRGNGPLPSALKVLSFAVGSRIGALALEHVTETLRPLPIEPIPETPAFLLGLSIVRGQPIPVIDSRRLLGDEPSHAALRLITLKAAPRSVALAVDAVLGIRELDPRALQELPPLLQTIRAEFVEAIGTVDAALLVVLRSGKLLPESFWERIPSGGEQT